MNHPPVVIPPHNPGQPGKPGDHRMPTPKPVEPGSRIDPRHNGDGHAVHPPERDHNGRPIDARPNRDQHGRDIPPGRDHIGRIDRDDFRHNIHHEQDHWNDRDHDYHWHEWDGWRVCHHYDEFGFHWWGFYVGSTYFWTRYHDDRYWWYDPYWHRWDYMNDGQWWYQDDFGNLYVYNNGFYYRYGSSDSGVIMTPDPTPPVEVPPTDPDQPAPTAPVNQSSVYSLDGTRSIQITGDNRDAYLYDLTVADPQSDAAQGRYIGTQVAGVNIIYLTSTADDGTETKAIQQIELSYDDSSSVSIVDLNGERRLDISDDAKNAILNNLGDSTVDPVFLTAGATGATLNYMQVTDENGAPLQSLLSITVTVADDSGNESTVSFDRDGAALDTSSPTPEGPDAPPDVPPSTARALPPTPAPAAIKTLQQKMEGSETFRALKAGFGW